MPRAITRGYQRIGVMPCLVCSREIPVKKTAGGKLSLACSWCDAPIYINQDSLAAELVMKRVTLDQAPPAAAASGSSIDKSLAPAPGGSAAPASSSKPPPEKKPAPTARSSWANPLNPIGG